MQPAAEGRPVKQVWHLPAAALAVKASKTSSFHVSFGSHLTSAAIQSALRKGRTDFAWCTAVLQTWWQTLAPPRWLWRTSAACVLGGQAIWRIATGDPPLAHHASHSPVCEIFRISLTDSSMMSATGNHRPAHNRLKIPSQPAPHGGHHLCVHIGSYSAMKGSALDLEPPVFAGKAHFRNTIEQLKLVGPNSLGVAMLTSSFVGMVFTIQASAFWLEYLQCVSSWMPSIAVLPGIHQAGQLQPAVPACGG